MATMNISLPDLMKTYVESQTLDGRYSNVSDYMRDLIRRDQARQAAVEQLRGVFDAGLASGSGRSYDMAGFIAERKAR